ncbi:hypothetical protein XH92_17695 [Bradyrhizobium sp. CCBAU 53421]|nr:hypothetical protein XH92_17695 [Bradyrhizobium sp. CCBAU 53421]
MRRIRNALQAELFLLDNLDRFWTPGGFTDDDALIVIRLAESMQEITRTSPRSCGIMTTPNSSFIRRSRPRVARQLIE